MVRKATKAAAVKADEQPMAPAPSTDPVPPITTGDKPDAMPQPDDDRAWLFDRGSSWLAERARQPEAAIRPLIDRWLRRLKDDATALRRVVVESGNVIEPLGWITIAVEARARKPAAGGSNGRV